VHRVGCQCGRGLRRPRRREGPAAAPGPARQSPPGLGRGPGPACRAGWPPARRTPAAQVTATRPAWCPLCRACRWPRRRVSHGHDGGDTRQLRCLATVTADPPPFVRARIARPWASRRSAGRSRW
jgi:hypothetical protein